MDTIDIIKESFETWYNKNHEDSSIIINYSDTQTMSIKAIHTACIEMIAVGVDGELATVTNILKLKENYNHGVTSEQEAKDMMATKLLIGLYDYMR